MANLPVSWGELGPLVEEQLRRARAGERPPPGWTYDFGRQGRGVSIPHMGGGLRGLPIMMGGPINRFDPKPGKPGTGLPGLPINGGTGPGFDPCALIFPSKSGTGYQACRAGMGLLPGFDTPHDPGSDPNQGDTCPEGYWKAPGTGQCVSLSDALPGGQPMTVGAGGAAVSGSFGLPAMTPYIVGFQNDSMGNTNPIRRCPTGMVLGKDDLCYPRQVLPRRSKWRKWRGERRPKVSAAEWSALQKANRTREKVKDVAKEAGWKVTTKGSSRGR